MLKPGTHVHGTFSKLPFEGTIIKSSLSAAYPNLINIRIIGPIHRYLPVGTDRDGSKVLTIGSQDKNVVLFGHDAESTNALKRDYKRCLSMIRQWIRSGFQEDIRQDIHRAFSKRIIDAAFETL